MDGIGREKEPRERLRQAQYTRVPSQASTVSSANTQMTPRTASSSSSQSPIAAQSSSHSTHRHHRTNSGRILEISRPSSRLSKETSGETRPGSPLVSSFLQERLEQQRRAESERISRKMWGDLSASTGDIRDRDIHGSPVRSSTALGQRSQSVAEDDDANSNGLGLKEMEKTVCTLHKQNFDLKLELYHRRERQDALEGKIQTLEAENAEMRGMREKIAEELATRDKAIQEAVDMIVQLEARVDDLVREREMVKQVESDGSYSHSRSDQSEHLDDDGAPLTPKTKGLEFFEMFNGAKSLERVPSFLSERSQQTENLRNVVIGGPSSLAHVRTVSEASVTPSDINRFTSPSLSVLSESSFVSIYGSKDEPGKLQMSPEIGSIRADSTLQGGLSTPARESNTRQMSQKSPVASWTPKGDPPQPGAVLSTLSPLQRIEMLDRQLPAAVEIVKSSTFGQGRSTPTSSPARSTRPAHVTMRQDKRNNIQRIITTGPSNKELANSHMLPPTPDTVASSTLRKHQNFGGSQDSLQENSFPTTRPERSDTFGVNNYRASPKMKEIPPSQRASMTAFSGRIDLPMPPINTEFLTKTINHVPIDLPARPRSADATTISRPRANSWGSDSDSDGGVDAHSEESTFDYWMRESVRPNAQQSGASAHTKAERKPSPDLFSFPTDSRGWGTDALFGALRGNGFLGSPAPDLRRERIGDMTTALGTPQTQTETFEPQEWGYAPPTPDRRSSLHARTGSTSVASPVTLKPKKTPVQNSSASRGVMNMKGRSNSIDSAAQVLSSKMHQQSEAPSPTKRGHYPPISGQGMRRSLGLSTIFRKSGSESHGSRPPSSATEATFPSNVAQLPPHVQSQFALRPGRSSVPPPPTMPWALRPPAVLDDELHSATPPPILRSRGLSQPPAMEAADSSAAQHPGASRAGQEEPAVPTGSSSSSNGPPSAGLNSSKRRWLNLSRMSNSLKNRTG